ncbi:MAG TPA: exodeoxyribonuclease VII large subunit, partial [Coleofasciculaceae cyanobacterium]
LQRETDRLAGLRQRLRLAMEHRLDRERDRQTALQQALRSLDPAQVVQRGYGVVRTEQGTLIRRANQVQPGDRLTIQLAEGWVFVTVGLTTPQP